MKGKRSSVMKKKTGFTLIEILVAFVIVCIFCSLAIPILLETGGRARAKKMGEYVSASQKVQVKAKEVEMKADKEFVDRMANGFRDCGNNIFSLNFTDIHLEDIDISHRSGLLGDVLSRFLDLHPDLKISEVVIADQTRGQYYPLWHCVLITEPKQLTAEKPIGK